MKHLAFTTRYNQKVRVLMTEIGVCAPITQEEAKKQDVKLNKYVGIWDTGATNSAITKKVADELGLKPTGITEVRHADGKSATNTYLINITLPSGVMAGQVRVTEVNLIPDGSPDNPNHPQLLIGMDIIGTGDLAVTTFEGKTTLSFRIPSSKEIDFIPESNENNVIEGGNRAQRRAFQNGQRDNKKRKGFR